MNCVYEGVSHVQKHDSLQELPPSKPADSSLHGTTTQAQVITSDHQDSSGTFEETTLESLSYEVRDPALEDVFRSEWNEEYGFSEESTYLAQINRLSTTGNDSITSEYRAAPNEHEAGSSLPPETNISHGDPQISSSWADPSTNRAFANQDGISSEPHKESYTGSGSTCTSLMINMQKVQLSLFSLKKTTTTKSLLSAKYLLGMLCSYPKMMLGENTLPPFIRLPYSIAGVFNLKENPEDCLPESLANCASIVQMFLTKTPANSALLWRTLESEQQRLFNDVRKVLNYLMSLILRCSWRC